MRNIHLNQTSLDGAPQRPRTVSGWTLAQALFLAGSLLACGGEPDPNAGNEPADEEIGTIEEELNLASLTAPGAYGQRIQADFNHDGKTDLLIVTASGSYEYLAIGNGQFQPNVYVRHDLPLGRVQYTLGDFNGDGRTDLFITTASGSYEYLAFGNGQFLPNVYVRPDLSLGRVQYVPGDFNGDGKTDLLIITASGTYEYLATNNGQFQPNVYVRHDLRLNRVRYVPGDYNGDGRTDLLIITASGTYEYLAVGNGQFQPNVYVRNDLPLGRVQYTPGDVNGNYGSPYIGWLITTCRSSDHGYRDYSAAFRSTT